ncbi:hypothetical protein IF1G_11118 [Cordyceps javanica]|uniref:Uncharacterized protein n=1 Tax=Cordyceps javanica TaxID=43265 RepID=A0A545UL89_9HYPO|nr:hypothetical protein IF1G_11118 [Cordyceps javanica]
MAGSTEIDGRPCPARSTNEPRKPGYVALALFLILEIALVALNSLNTYALISPTKKAASRGFETNESVSQLACCSHLIAYSITAGGSAALHVMIGIVSFIIRKPLKIYKWTHFGLAIVLVVIGPCIAIEASRSGGGGGFTRCSRHSTLYFRLLYYGGFCQSIYGVAGIILIAIAFIKSAFS